MKILHLSYKVLLAFILILPGICRAADELQPSACFRQAAERHEIPVELLIAVAQAESGLKPYAMNRAGASILPRSREDAENILKRIGQERPTFDVGIMQVNRWWFEKYGQPYEKGLDVCFNVDFGARILAMAIKDHGFTWKAIGVYHSPTDSRQSAYARRIFSRLEKIMQKRREVPIEELLDGMLGSAVKVSAG